MKSSKQIFIGVSSVFTMWLLQTLFCGEIGFIDTISLGTGSALLCNFFSFVYITVFIIVGFISRQRSYPSLFKTYFITSIIPVIYSLVVNSEDYFINLAQTTNNVIFKMISEFNNIIIVLCYPLISIGYSFGISDLRYLLFILSPMACALAYFAVPIINKITEQK